MDLNHVAIFIDDIDTSVLGPSLGGWRMPATPISRQPVTVDGLPAELSGRTRDVQTAGNSAFAVSIEDAVAGAPVQPVPGNAWHHVAVWCDDMTGTVKTLEAEGYRKEVVGRGPEGELATFAYMVSDIGPRLELGETAMRDRIRQYRAKAATANDASERADSGVAAPLIPLAVTVVVRTAADIDRLATCWQKALGTRWEGVINSAVSVQTAGGSHELRTRSVSSSGTPCVTIAAPEIESRTLLAPVAANGWHHVSFGSADLLQDVANFERSGFTLEFSGGGEDAFAMMIAPEGARIKLVAR